MNRNSMAFIAFEERENLGVRYLAAVLSRAGYQVDVIDFRKDKNEILEKIQTINPVLVGFSIIFEEQIYNFQEFIEFLRKNGLRNHFTAGGHFASLRPAELFEMIPGIDSIVRFEGEHTLLDLMHQLHSGSNWKKVSGISYRSDGIIVNNNLRSLEKNLDRFPTPLRSETKQFALEKKYVTILASRGCFHDCNHCNIKEFYGIPSGPLKRVRNPVMVVEEMESLYLNHGCSIFLFQDDDFPFTGWKNGEWIDDFCSALLDKDLVGKIMLKVNCRPDEIEPGMIYKMKEHGLFKVFMGIEDGTESGLQKMNKRQKVSDNIRGIRILKEHQINIDFGFMLFQPATTYPSLYENLEFLSSICSDGYMPVTFMKMLPFLGTRIEKELRMEDRLIGRPGFYDYNLNDQSLNDLHLFIFQLFDTWMSAPEGLANMSKWAMDYLSVFTFYNGSRSIIEDLSRELLTQVADANMFMLGTLQEVSEKFESANYQFHQDMELEEFSRSVAWKHDAIIEIIREIIGKVELLNLTKAFFRV